jgi:medium-chain acyl-[acyl-carrier-protein] hydrolase
MMLDRWVPFRNESALVRCRLFSFPHAAGNATLYQPLRRCMPLEIDLCPVELPGRAARLGEPPLTSMDALMGELRHAFLPLMSVPFAFFGHSVGAWIAYQAARQLRSVDGRTALHLFVSGRGSPASGDSAMVRPRSNRELLTILERFGGTPATVMQEPELMAVLLPALRADLALAEGYRDNARDRLACPITAFGGADDISHSALLQSWSDFTRGRFRKRAFPGGHFYFWPAPEALAKEIVQDLRASLGASVDDVRSRT